MAKHLGDHLKIAVILLLVVAIGYNLVTNPGLFDLAEGATSAATTEVIVSESTTPSLNGDQIFTGLFSILVLFLLGMGGYYFKNKAFFHHRPAGGHSAKRTAAVDSDLLFYCKEAKKVGYGDTQIRARLKRAGWNNKEVSSALKQCK